MFLQIQRKRILNFCIIHYDLPTVLLICHTHASQYFFNYIVFLACIHLQTLHSAFETTLSAEEMNER